jgi:hypothetical protein
MAVAFMWLGPLPFIPLKPDVDVIVPTVAVAAGLGSAAIILSSFARAHETAIKAGFQNSLSTNIVVAGRKCFYYWSMISLSLQMLSFQACGRPVLTWEPF